MSDDADRVTEEAVPKLPRGRGLRLSGPQMVRIAGTAFLLVFLLMVQRPCSDAVSTFVTDFGDQGSATAVMPRPGNVDLPAGSADRVGSGSAAAGEAPDLEQYEHLRPGMSDDEIKAAIERARAKAAGGSGAP